ncbi:hypothetical protein HDU86_005594 [Geranomyces michiganensis]|nr:hypothetical protein HDU86_005594 [Geranomyces michiganensis]
MPDSDAKLTWFMSRGQVIRHFASSKKPLTKKQQHPFHRHAEVDVAMEWIGDQWVLDGEHLADGPTTASFLPPQAAVPATPAAAPATTREPFQRFPREVTARDSLDIQGILWAGMPISRDRFHELRHANYVSFANTDNPRDLSPSFAMRDDGRLYDWYRTSLANKCSVEHMQLRNLVWATSKNDVYYTDRSGVQHWCAVTAKTTPALSLARQDVGGMLISCIAARHGVLLAGGFCGEFLLRRIGHDEDDGVVTKGVITHDPNGSINHIDVVYGRTTAGPQAIFSTNDHRVRVMDIETRVTKSTMGFEAAINCSSLSPDKRLLCAVGDMQNGYIVDSQDGKHLGTLTGHTDWSFACAWSPNGTLLATGNQDRTTRIYDTRNMKRTLATLPATMGAVRSLRFSDDARVLAIAESVDYVRLVDTDGLVAVAAAAAGDGDTPLHANGYTAALDAGKHHRTQLVDFFGEVAGLSFCPGSSGDDVLFIGISDPRYGGLIELHRTRGLEHRYLDLL